MNNKISFPIIHGNCSVCKKEFKAAVLKLQQKFNIDLNHATNLAEDLIKCMICENKSDDNLEHEVNSLGCPIWSFLKNQNISEVIDWVDTRNNKPEKQPWWKFWEKCR